MSLYHEAADILSNSATDGGSLKSRVFKKKGLKSPPNQIYALVLESCKWSPVLKEVIDRAQLLKHERKLTPHLALLLVHDLLVAKGGIALPQTHGLRASIDRHKARLSSEFTLARLRRKVPTLNALREVIERDAIGEEAQHPRWVRVNALKSSVEEQLETTFKDYERATSVKDVATASGKRIFIDPHVPRLLAVTPSADMSKTEAYSQGKIILQDKASCFPAYLLDPHVEDGDVIDACAAPGNKTTHLAAILHEHQPEGVAQEQKIYAFERDSKRALTLEKMVKIAGSNKTMQIGKGQDFLQVKPNSEKYSKVGALLLDPSCSGSGIVGRDSMPELHLPESSDKVSQPKPLSKSKGKNKQDEKSGDSSSSQKRKHEAVEESDDKMVLRDDDGNEIVAASERDLDARLDALAGFQLKLLLHALRFPAAKRVTYSTCSIHAQENENVVMKALQSDVAISRGWKILKREDQVTGMKEWPVRGVPEYCDGSKEIAEGCIRSYKDDGQGVMGFFVAGFVRLDGEAGAADGSDEGPYERDEEGLIVRDVMGMPILKATGLPFAVAAAGEGNASASGVDSDNAMRASDGESSSSSEDSDESDGGEWGGFAD